ncbi:MAG: hypothetical protein IT265_07215 [Saprospiraceae bacterium]|nr:hypothetical protein [Saprospiraceae bacterium]
MLQYFTTDSYRAALLKFIENLNANRFKLGINEEITLDNANIAPYTVRLHSKLASGQNSYDLDLKTGSGVVVEKKLVDSDIFQAFGMAMGIQRYDPTAPDFSKPIWFSPDATEFTTAAPQLELLYNGDSTINTDGTNRLQRFDNHLFRTAPSGQAVYGPSFQERGYYIFPSYPVFYGSKVNKVTINLAPGATNLIAGAGVTSNNLVILLTGFRFNGINSGTGCNV